MPVYEYVCSACGHHAEILHGVNDAGPQFCTSCGTEGTLRKAFAAPAILFKGSGWAKKDRRSTSSSSARSGAAPGGEPAASPGAEGGSAGSPSTDGGDKGAPKPSEPTSAAKPAD